MKIAFLLFILGMIALKVCAQEPRKFDGLNMNMGNLSRASEATTRSIGPENPTGEKGKGGMANPFRSKGNSILQMQPEQQWILVSAGK